MILIFSKKFDYSTTCVMKWLNFYGKKVVRINGDEDTYQFISINSKGVFFRNRITNELINLKEARACWWRRVGISNKQFNIDPHYSESIFHRDDIKFFTSSESIHLEEETIALRNYIFNMIYENASINLGKPTFDLNRLIVSDIAQRFGFIVPKFEIITNGEQLVSSRKRIGKAVTKAISNGIYDQVYSKRFYTYTELIESEFYKRNSNINFFPSLISELIEKEIEIRSFYIDGNFYSMAIFSQSNEKTKVDFRKYADNKNIPYKLPSEIEQRLTQIFQSLGLNTGSVDLIIDKNDNYIFLEINPVGQYGMTSDPCNYNLDNIISKYLIYGRVETN